MEKECWRIELCERPVHLVKKVDQFLFGKSLSHPFLVLVDDADKILSELHYIPYDRTSSTGLSRVSRHFQRCQAFTTPVGCDLIVRKVIGHTPWKETFPVLRSRFYDSARQYDSATHKVTVDTGLRERLENVWKKLMAASYALDALNLPYDRFGWGNSRYNCQTAIASILAAAGVKAPLLSNRLAAPGWKIIPLQATGSAPRQTL